MEDFINLGTFLFTAGGVLIGVLSGAGRRFIDGLLKKKQDAHENEREHVSLENTISRKLLDSERRYDQKLVEFSNKISEDIQEVTEAVHKLEVAVTKEYRCKDDCDTCRKEIVDRIVALEAKPARKLNGRNN